MSTVPADLTGKSDAELIAEVRSGDLAAYGTLYERHTGAAHNLARQLSRSSSEADDLVSDAFAKVLDTLRGATDGDRAFRQSQVDAAVRFCAKVFGQEYASLLAKAAEVASHDHERKVATRA